MNTPPKILDPWENLRPKPTRSDKLKNRFPKLADYQSQAAECALERIKHNESFLLTDGPGMGKTLALIAAAWKTAEMTGGRALLATSSQELCDTLESTVLKENTNAHIDVCTIEEIHGKIKNYALVAIDEAHKLCNHPEAARALNESKIPKILASASAFLCPEALVLLSALTLGKSQEEVTEKLDLCFLGEDAIPKTNWGETTNRIEKLKRKMTKKGACISRHLEPPSDSKWIASPRDGRSNQILQTAAKEIKKGRQVVIYSNNPKIKEALAHCAENSTLHPTSPKEFQKGIGNLCLLDPQLQAEGIRLHDKSGKSPRTILIDGVPTAADLLQMEGRIHRRNSRSSPKIRGFQDPADKGEATALLNLQTACLLLEELKEATPSLGKAQNLEKPEHAVH